MIFIVQINKVPKVTQKYKFNNIRRSQNFSTAIQSTLCPSDMLTELSYKLFLPDCQRHPSAHVNTEHSNLFWMDFSFFLVLDLLGSYHPSIWKNKKPGNTAKDSMMAQNIVFSFNQLPHDI